MSGAMWWLAEDIALQGLVSMVFANSPAYLAPHSGSKRAFGTNPMGFGWPRPGGLPPLVWDQASSAMARGEVELRRQEGKALPPNVGIDPAGAPSTDPAEVRHLPAVFINSFSQATCSNCSPTLHPHYSPAVPYACSREYWEFHAQVLAGCQLPFGGHKGSNIALMVELLGATPNCH